jgi:DNA-binding transcriptional regulator GbsR (MarR family)
MKNRERKEFFEAEKNVWEMFRRITRERKRREIDPALETLRKCRDATKGMKNRDAKVFHKQISELEDFVSFGSKMSDRVGSMQHGKAIKLAMKLLG